MQSGFRLVTWALVYTSQARKDAKKLAKSGLKEKALEIINIVKQKPFQNPPPYEKLVGSLAGTYSRRINIQHRLVYQTHAEEKVVKIIRMWTHYE
jgi:Txe/YoeB family toxin of toxin-antitoxin system